METPYKVSILVPIYGVEKYIERCAVSLFEQTYEDIEYIFVNDCTKDNSIAILKEVIERYPVRKPQVRIIEHEQNKGLGGARNTAVAASTGTFIMHVDSDDYVDKEIVRKFIDKQQSEDYDIVTCDIVCVGPNYNQYIKSLEATSPKDFAAMTIRHSVRNSVWGRLIRRSLYTDNYIEVQNGINMSEDLQVIPFLFYNSTKIGFLHEFLHFYDCTNINSYTYSFSEHKVEQVFQTLRKLEEKFSRNEDMLDAVRYRMYGNYGAALINCVQSSGHKAFYHKTRSELSKLNVKDKSALPVYRRWLVNIPNYYLFTAAVRLLAPIFKVVKYYNKKV